MFLLDVVEVWWVQSVPGEATQLFLLLVVFYHSVYKNAHHQLRIKFLFKKRIMLKTEDRTAAHLLRLMSCSFL